MALKLLEWRPRLWSGRGRLRGRVLMRAWLLVMVSAAALVIPAAASARVRLVHVTSPINHGSYATLAVSLSVRATCSITVEYKSGPSQAAGLYPKASVGGRVSWTWKVGTRTTPGRWP